MLRANRPVLSRRIGSHRIISDRIFSHMLASHRIGSHRIISGRISSYRIASYHVVSHRIVYDTSAIGSGTKAVEVESAKRAECGHGDMEESEQGVTSALAVVFSDGLRKCSFFASSTFSVAECRAWKEVRGRRFWRGMESSGSVARLLAGGSLLQATRQHQH